MDFSTKGKEAITRLLAEEIRTHIEAGEIKNAEELEKGLREIL